MIHVLSRCFLIDQSRIACRLGWEVSIFYLACPDSIYFSTIWIPLKFSPIRFGVVLYVGLLDFKRSVSWCIGKFHIFILCSFFDCCSFLLWLCGGIIFLIILVTMQPEWISGCPLLLSSLNLVRWSGVAAKVIDQRLYNIDKLIPWKQITLVHYTQMQTI